MVNPASSAGGTTMGSDFNSCRFDFRLDVKTGLLPSRRRRRGGGSTPGAGKGRGVATSASTGYERTGLATGGEHDKRASRGGRCSTLYSCKICGYLLRSRDDRKAHYFAVHHKQSARPVGPARPTRHEQSKKPTGRLADITPRYPPLLVLGVTHPGFRPNDGSLPVVIRSFSATDDSSTSSELRDPANFHLLRSSCTLRPQQSTQTSLPSADMSSQNTCDVVAEEGLQDSIHAAMSSSFHFRSPDDVIASRDDDTASGVVSTSGLIGDETSCGICFSDPPVLDLTTKSTGDNCSRFAVLTTGDASKGDFRSSLERQRKSRGLDLTVQKLWRFKMQQQQQQQQRACAADDVIFDDIEKSASDNQGNQDSTSERSDIDANRACRLVGERPRFEMSAGKVTGSRSSDHREGNAGAELKLRRVMATRGEQPRFYTSLMRFQSTRRKPCTAQVSRWQFIYPLRKWL